MADIVITETPLHYQIEEEALHYVTEITNDSQTEEQELDYETEDD